jgi:DNA/RNA-binding domain of Phe-tRNA-synthetase-like protein
MTTPAVQIAPDLLSIVSLGVLHLDEVRNAEHEARLDEPLARAEAAVRRQPPSERAAVRAMYWRVGIDPTRRRPSSEALLRRVLRGDALPRINALVDICNWCSLELQLPYGLYDLERVEGPIALRLGQPGEEYVGIRKDAVHVGGRLTLADRRGPFGNPTSDSARTMVTPSTARALAVIFAPRDLPASVVEAAVRLTSDRAAQFTGAREVGRFVV